MSSEDSLEPLTAAERRAVLLMRALGPYDIIEIRLNDRKPDEIAITEKSTAREIFPVDMV